MHFQTRAVVRYFLIGLLIFACSCGTAAAVAYLMLDDSTWTEPSPTRPPATATAVPAPAAPTSAPDPTARWRLGSCLTEDLAPADCTTPGTLHIVGVVQDPGDAPCSGVPGDPITRRVDGTALCLTRH